MPSDNTAPHIHISLEELRTAQSLSEDKMPESGLLLLEQIADRIDKCDVCRKRYEFFRRSENLIQDIFPNVEPLNELTDMIRENLLSLGGKLQASLEAWLKSSPSFASLPDILTVQPLELAVRNLHSQVSVCEIHPQTAYIENIPPGETVSIRPEASITVSIVLDKEKLSTPPICVILFTQKYKLFRIVPLRSSLDQSEYRTGRIDLDAGEYFIMVLTEPR